jgi:hypothetical protein
MEHTSTVAYSVKKQVLCFVEGNPLHEHAVSRIEAKSRLSQITALGFSGEAVRDSRIVVAFSILSIALTFGGL